MQQITAAFQYLFRAQQMARSAGLRRWVAIPLIFNALLFGGLFVAASSWINGLVAAMTQDWVLTGFWSFLNAVIEAAVGMALLLVWLLLLGIFASIFTYAVQIVAAPFMGLLAEKVDLEITQQPMPEESIPAMVMRTFKRELRKTWYWLWRALAVLVVVAIMYFIPGLNVIASAVWFLWSGWLLGIQYVDFGADNRQTSFNMMLAKVNQRPWLVLSFGSLVLAMTMIPLMNLVIMPVAVVAGTLIWVEELSGKPVAETNPKGGSGPDSETEAETARERQAENANLPPVN